MKILTTNSKKIKNNKSYNVRYNDNHRDMIILTEKGGFDTISLIGDIREDGMILSIYQKNGIYAILTFENKNEKEIFHSTLS